MCIWDWFAGILGDLGLWKNSVEMPAVLVMAKGGLIIQSNPTSHFSLNVLNLGGHTQARRVWKDYFPAVDAIEFLINAWDRSSFMESKHELDCLLTDETLSNCPVLIFGYNSDIRGAASEDELRNYFALHQLTTGKGKVARSELSGRPLELFMCTSLGYYGLRQGRRWLGQYIYEEAGSCS